MGGPLCQCGRIREKFVAGEHASFPGRQYYRCSSSDCKNKFDWADDVWTHPKRQGEHGPPCACGTVSVERAIKKNGPERGRKFWGCAKFPTGCDFFEWKEQAREPPHVVSPARPVKHNKLPGTVYGPDWNKERLLRKILNVSVDPKKLTKQSNGLYDSFQMVDAWNIVNSTRMKSYQRAKLRERQKCGNNGNPFNFPPDYDSVMRELGQHDLDNRAGEVLLLHSTSPTNLYSILFEGLDPIIANDGKFGRGVHFAENAGKCDLYTTTDKKWDAEGPLADLHKELYDEMPHPKGVRYCLVARVVLGRPVRTIDGVRQLDSPRLLFQDNNDRSQLNTFDHSNGVQPSSIVAETDGFNNFYREFVVFNPDQILFQYVIAYRRVRRFCNCGDEVAERTVKVDTDNRGRTIHFCQQSKCGFIQMFPLCYCGLSAIVKSSYGKKYYTCGSKTNSDETCDFWDWCKEAAVVSPYKKQKNNKSVIK